MAFDVGFPASSSSGGAAFGQQLHSNVINDTLVLTRYDKARTTGF